jgi:site-specific DNA recombinase
VLRRPVEITSHNGRYAQAQSDLTRDDDRSPDMSLLRVVTRTHDVHRRLVENPTLTVHDVAREQGMTTKYLYILLRLRWLAPDITTAIVNGRQPRQLNAMRLMRLTAQLQADWPRQRDLLGLR